jgi:uncharacterized protein YjbJ (UPF0337 family)
LAIVVVTTGEFVMSDNRVEGAAHKLSGSIKEGFGKATGDAKLQAQGAAEKAGGSVQNAAGKAEDVVRGEPRAFADHDRVEGSGRQLSGKVKEGVGHLTGDEKLKAEGKGDQVAGKVQNAIGGVKDAVRDAFRKD